MHEPLTGSSGKKSKSCLQGSLPHRRALPGEIYGPHQREAAEGRRGGLASPYSMPGLAQCLLHSRTPMVYTHLPLSPALLPSPTPSGCPHL